ncbi:TRAP transporter large permease [Anaerotruncus colihominis]|nr:TRAP transporter large permease [Anaerotruncus colihominis]
MIGITVIGLLVLAFLGIPIAWALGISSTVAIWVDGSVPASLVVQKMINGMDSFSLMAIPFFILAGNLMSGGGLTERLLNIAKALIGWVRGSVSIVCIVASMFFGAITGSAVATASAIGGMTIPEMIKENYGRSYAAAVTTGAAICGPMIPPSIGLIIYASMTDTNVRDLFMGTLFPGILYGLFLCGTAWMIAKKRNYITHPFEGFRNLWKTIRSGITALLMPVAVLGSIFGGLATPTEAAVVAVAYALIVSVFIYRDLTWKQIYKILVDSAVATAVMYIVIGISGAVGWIVAVSNVSTTLTNMVASSGVGKIGTIIFILALGLIFGCIMDVVAAILIVTPVLYALAAPLGYTTVEFGVILVTLLTLGHITPPVGASLLLSNSMAGADIRTTIKEAVPFFFCGFGLVVLLFIFPQIISILVP